MSFFQDQESILKNCAFQATFLILPTLVVLHFKIIDIPLKTSNNAMRNIPHALLTSVQKIIPNELFNDFAEKLPWKSISYISSNDIGKMSKVALGTLGTFCSLFIREDLNYFARQRS